MRFMVPDWKLIAIGEEQQRRAAISRRKIAFVSQRIGDGICVEI